jgi:prevent-host-death family protein
MKTRARTKTPVRAKSRGTAKAPGTAKNLITATEAARKFSEILNRVAYKGESFVVERSGRPVCEITPVAKDKRFTGADFLNLIKTVPRPDDQYFTDVEEIIRNRQPVASSLW